MSAQTFTQFWHDDRVNSVAVYLKELRSERIVDARLFAGNSAGDGEFGSTRIDHCERVSSKFSTRPLR